MFKKFRTFTITLLVYSRDSNKKAEVRENPADERLLNAMVRYRRFGNFHENFILVKSIKRHFSDVKNSRLRQDLPISIKDRVILPFREGFIFMNLRICKVSRKLSPHENFRIYSIRPDHEIMVLISIMSLFK